MELGKYLLAMTALVLVHPVAAQDAPIEEAQPAPTPPPVTTTPAITTSASEEPTADPAQEGGDEAATAAVPPAPPALLIPPPAPPPAPPPLSLSRLDRTPPTNIKGPYPENQLPVTQLIGTEEKLEWIQMPAVFLPGLTSAGRARVLENQTLVDIPLHWSMSAYLQSDVTIEGIGKPVELKSGDIIPQVVLAKGRGADDRFTLFCTRSRILQKEEGLFEGVFDSMRDAQWCLQDTDSDGSFDLAVAISAGAPVKKAADITPIPYEMRYGQRIPGDDNFVRFVMTRVSKKNVDIGLRIFQTGEPMAFHTMTSGSYRAKSVTPIRYRNVENPNTLILGVTFRVHFADRKGNLAEVEWAPSSYNSSAIIPIPTELTTTYSYY